jgi:hypothetical protein
MAVAVYRTLIHIIYLYACSLVIYLTHIISLHVIAANKAAKEEEDLTYPYQSFIHSFFLSLFAFHWVDGLR